MFSITVPLDYTQTKTFIKNFQKIDKTIQERLKEEMSRILRNPKDSYDTLKNPSHKGCRTCRVGDYRFIYIYCKEAREFEASGFITKQIIDGHPDEIIIFLDVGHRNQIYKNYN